MTETEEAKKKRVSTAEKKRQEVRKAVWPALAERDLWLRSTSKGYTTIPRTLPLIVEIINCMTKGAPAGGVYFELWCRAFDEMFVDMDDAEGMAFAAGFSGQRAVTTWRGRIQALEKLNFIDVQKRGGHSYALILNPYHILYAHHLMKTPGLTEDHFASLKIRATEIGARDLADAVEIYGTTPKNGASI